MQASPAATTPAAAAVVAAGALAQQAPPAQPPQNPAQQPVPLRAAAAPAVPLLARFRHALWTICKISVLFVLFSPGMTFVQLTFLICFCILLFCFNMGILQFVEAPFAPPAAHINRNPQPEPQLAQNPEPPRGRLFRVLGELGWFAREFVFSLLPFRCVSSDTLCLCSHTLCLVAETPK
jgi:hypothetical protein